MIDTHINIDFLRKCPHKSAFIETGTYKGDTCILVRMLGYQEVHSIELNTELFEMAREFFHKTDQSVQIYHGDSIDCLPIILAKMKEPATIWLDAHASGPLVGGKSGGTPVIDELKIIKASGIKNHTIMIDDCRLFGCEEWSFVKQEDAIAILKEINPNYTIEYISGYVEKDIMIAYDWS